MRINPVECLTMDALADSKAFRDNDRVLPQHQAALLLLQKMLADPKVLSVKWLDLACGRGQILIGINDGLPPRLRGLRSTTSGMT
jgi:hypothetical protein